MMRIIVLLFSAVFAVSCDQPRKIEVRCEPPRILEKAFEASLTAISGLH